MSGSTGGAAERCGILLSGGAGFEARGGEVFRHAKGLNDFLGFIILDEGLAGCIQKAGRHKDDEVLFDFLIHTRAEQATRQRDVAKEWHLIINLLHILADQAAHGHGLAIPNAHAGFDSSDRENGLVHHIFCDCVRCYS